MSCPSAHNESQVIGSTVDSAAETAKDVIDQTASWAGQAGNSDGARRVDRIAESAARTVDAAASTVKQTADSAWDVAQRTHEQASGMARDVYERGQQIGAEVVRQTQDQPVVAIMMALSAGILIGFSLSMLFRSR